jgi:hypothetical protein
MMLKPMLDLASYWKDSVLTYAIYPTAQANEFSVIADVTIENKIETWYGKNRDEIASHIDEKGYRISIGTFKQLRVMRRPVQGQGGTSLIQQVRDRGDGTYDFILTTGKNYIPKAQDIVYFNGQYYDGGTRRKIGSALDYTLSFSKNNAPIGEKYFKIGNTPRVFADLSGVTYLYLGNGLYAEVVYLKETRLFTVEETGTIANLRRKWENSGSAIDYASYYNALCKALEDLQGGLIVDV